MKEHIIKTYSFDELSEDAKQKAIENLQNINVDFEWYESIYEDAEQIELKITEFDIDRGSYCHADFVNNAEQTAELILQNHGECCETFQDAINYQKELKDIFDLYPDDVSGYCDLLRDDAIEDLDSEFLKTLQEDYRIMLQKEYEYLTSEESIIETIKANEYEFTENGKLW